MPGGEKMARRTSNPRLGIVGGISILGTTGIVRPFSTAAWRASVGQAIDVMDAQGTRTLVLTTGGRSERAARRLAPELPEVCFVEVGDFTGYALKRAVRARVRALPVRRHGGQAVQARGRRADDPLDAVEGRPAVPGGADRGGGRRRDRGGRRERGQQRAPRVRAVGGGRRRAGRPTSCARRWRPTSRPTSRTGSRSTRSWSTSRARTWSARARARASAWLRRRWRDRRARRRRRRASGGERASCSRTRRWSPAAGATSTRWPPPGAEQVALTGELEPALDALAAHEGEACVLASGDPGFYGIVRALAARVGADALDVRPGAVVGGCRLRAPGPRVGRRARASAATAATRTPRWRAALRHPKVAILTAPAAPPAWYAQRLAGSGRALAVAERLGERDERVVRGHARGDRAGDLRRAQRAPRPRSGERRQRSRAGVAAAHAGRRGPCPTAPSSTGPGW